MTNTSNRDCLVCKQPVFIVARDTVNMHLGSGLYAPIHRSCSEALSETIAIRKSQDAREVDHSAGASGVSDLIHQRPEPAAPPVQDANSGLQMGSTVVMARCSKCDAPTMTYDGTTVHAGPCSAPLKGLGGTVAPAGLIAPVQKGGEIVHKAFPMCPVCGFVVYPGKHFVHTACQEGSGVLAR